MVPSGLKDYQASENQKDDGWHHKLELSWHHVIQYHVTPQAHESAVVICFGFDFFSYFLNFLYIQILTEFLHLITIKYLGVIYHCSEQTE